MDGKAFITNNSVVTTNNHVSSIAGKKVEHTTETVLIDRSSLSGSALDIGESTLNYDGSTGTGTSIYNIDNFDYIVIFYAKNSGYPTNLVSEEIKINGTGNIYHSSETTQNILSSSHVYIQSRAMDINSTYVDVKYASQMLFGSSGFVASGFITNSSSMLVPYKIIGYKYSE